MLKHVDSKSPVIVENLLNKKAKVIESTKRKEQLQKMTCDLKNLVPPGMRPIKQVELCAKWKKIVPVDKKDLTCPRPSQDIMKQVKEEKKVKKDSKKRKTDTVLTSIESTFMSKNLFE